MTMRANAPPIPPPAVLPDPAAHLATLALGAARRLDAGAALAADLVARLSVARDAVMARGDRVDATRLLIVLRDLVSEAERLQVFLECNAAMFAKRGPAA